MDKPKKCIQEQRILELEKKVEYMERVIQALIRGKKDIKIEVHMGKEIVGYKSKFDMEMEKVGKYNQYRGDL